MKIKKASEMIMSTELVNMKRVMRRLDMIDKNDVPLLKGKVSAGISASDEILTTELIFSGFFQELDPIQMAAVLSCLVFNDTKSEGKPPKDEKLSVPFIALQETIKRVATIMEESGMEIKKDEFLLKFAPEMMETTYAWCKGAKFNEICEISETPIFEGTIIRCLRRLDELIS